MYRPVRMRWGVRPFQGRGYAQPGGHLTKILNRAVMDSHLGRLGTNREDGRAATAPRVTADVDASLAADAGT